MSANVRLRGPDGLVPLASKGTECDRFGVYLHCIDTPDPGVDLHDHPWWFGSLVLYGGYTEVRTDIKNQVYTHSIWR